MKNERMRYLRLSIAEYEDVLPRAVTSMLNAAKAVGTPTADVIFKKEDLDIEHRKARFLEAFDTCLAEIKELRCLLDEKQSGGIAHRDQPATRDRDSAGS